MRRSGDYSRPRRRTLERIDRLQPRYFLAAGGQPLLVPQPPVDRVPQRFQQSLERRALTDLRGLENIRPMRKSKRAVARMPRSSHHGNGFHAGCNTRRN